MKILNIEDKLKYYYEYGFKFYYIKKFNFLYHFIGFRHWSFGISFYFGERFSNIEIHLPAGFLRIGQESFSDTKKFNLKKVYLDKRSKNFNIGLFYEKI